jgi:NADH dehydrogenase FAD-containing subunit
MTDKLSRRDFLQASGGLVLAAGASGSVLAADGQMQAPAVVGQTVKKAPLPSARGPRVVVVGGGWSGLTVAKYLKRFDRDFDVVLIDRNALFVSCPMSNLWMADQVSMDFLTHSYIDAARNNDYLFFNATVIDLDREARRVFTEQGYIEYDYLVLAPGIDYDYARIGIEDMEEEYYIRSNYPGGYVNASEYLAIKHKLENFKGGTFLLTVPAGNYRCTAAPYERACMAAAIIKRNGVKGKVLLLDHNADIKIKKDGFRKAFETLYPDIIQYEPSADIVSVNLEDREVETEFDAYQFDDAAIYAPVRASKIIEHMGLVDPDSHQKEAHIDQFRNHIIGDEHVYVTGDSRPQPFSKSGHTANSEGKFVAEVIAAHHQGVDVEWRSPQTMCFSGVKIDPLEAMNIITYYRYDKGRETFDFDRVHLVEEWSVKSGQAGLAWAEGMFRDMFYG